MVKIVAVSDTHNQHHKLDLPDGDIFVHCGDFTIGGSEKEVVKFADWINTLDFQHKVIVPGNHDFMFSRMLPLCRDMMPNVVILVDESVKLFDVNIYGSPWVPLGPRWAYSYNRENSQRAKQIWENIPKSVDLLLTHGPPRGILDLVESKENVGCEHLQEALKNRYPHVHCFGHIHEGYGRMNSFAFPGTEFVNCSVLDENYSLVNKPQVIIL